MSVPRQLIPLGSYPFWERPQDKKKRNLWDSISTHALLDKGLKDSDFAVFSEFHGGALCNPNAVRISQNQLYLRQYCVKARFLNLFGACEKWRVSIAQIIDCL